MNRELFYKSPIIIGGLALLLTAASACAQQNPVNSARKLAVAGQRAQAESMLLTRLAESPGDTGARTLYDTLLSWDGNYGEARKQLEQVLRENAADGDAMQALANVELWTDHPDKAHDLLLPLLREHPNDTDLLYADARALIALKRPEEADKELSHLLETDPGNQDARRLRERLGEGSLPWEAFIQESYEWFSDGIGNRAESQVSLKGLTPAGSIIGRFSNAERFGFVSNQVDVDFYPGFRKGTYAWLNLGFSPDRNLYPQYRMGADIFQALGRGFEGTLGYRRLGFSSKVNIFTTALSKYHGDWLFTARGFFTPDVMGTSQSVQLIARRYFRDSSTFVQFRFGRGSTPNEIRSVIDLGMLNSTLYDAAAHRAIGRRWLADAELGWSREDRPGRPLVNHYIANLGATLRF